MNPPRLLFAAPASGCGKTTVTCAVLQALVNRGLDPVAFKSGPDYIDPMFHAEVLGAVRRSLRQNCAGHGPAILEGAMGYYDGAALSSELSAWDLARRTATPAVLVVDGRGAARSLAAVVKGFCALEEEHGIRGVLFNRVSPMFYPALKDCVEKETGIPVYGYLPVLPDASLESRHLGLITAAEVSDLRGKLSALAAQAEKSIDLDGLLALAEAFCFYYADALELLEKLGAELVPFSPLRDEEFPEGCAGLYLGGGYPELYGAALANNTAMRRAVRLAVNRGMPTVAECGGFLYLHRTLSDADGVDRPLAGALPAAAWNQGKLGRFGYITLTARTEGLLCGAGEGLPAHEFHYWESDRPGADFHAQKPRSKRGWDCAWHTPTLYAGFPHVHFCGCQQAAERFVAACARYHGENEG